MPKLHPIMPTTVYQDPTAHPGFACPIHKILLRADYFCAACGNRFPAVDGIPVLLNEKNSVFRISEYLEAGSAYGGASSYAGHVDKRGGLSQLYRRLVFSISESKLPKREFDCDLAVKHVLEQRPHARLLVIGAGDASVLGEAVYTDVAFGRKVNCIADAHDLPFETSSFDACIACAVLEHVADPQRCVEEIVRVLRPGGFVYAETPFMQPVHMGAHDFTRFTYLGHRRLFRCFDEIHSGMCGGPGVSAGQILRYTISALSNRPTLRKWLKLFGLLVTYPLRWIDMLTAKNAAAYDSASAFFFFGRLRPDPITDREILSFYRGG